MITCDNSKCDKDIKFFEYVIQRHTKAKDDKNKWQSDAVLSFARLRMDGMGRGEKGTREFSQEIPTKSEYPAW